MRALQPVPGFTRQRHTGRSRHPGWLLLAIYSEMGVGDKYEEEGLVHFWLAGTLVMLANPEKILGLEEAGGTARYWRLILCCAFCTPSFIMRGAIRQDKIFGGAPRIQIYRCLHTA